MQDPVIQKECHLRLDSEVHYVVEVYITCTTLGGQLGQMSRPISPIRVDDKSEVMYYTRHSLEWFITFIPY